MNYAVIMAGGLGKRLWPLSRRLRPKQLLRIIAGESLLDLSIARLEDLVPPENILIVTNRIYVEEMSKDHPEIPAANFLGEPEGRGTANAIGLAAALLLDRDPEAVMAVFTADQVIEPTERFQSAVRCAIGQAKHHPEALITFGVRPTSPHTGYGYVEAGDRTAESIFRVRSFREKPPTAVAQEYIAKGNFYWNSGMFVWRADTIMAELARHLPDSYRGLQTILKSAPAQREAAIEQVYPRLPAISIDYAVMEKAAGEGKVLMVELPCRWMDMGSWPALAQIVAPDAQGNVVAAASTHAAGARNNIVVSEDDHLLVLLGVEDVVVVHSPDATLVMGRDKAEEIKDVVDQLARRFGERYT